MQVTCANREVLAKIDRFLTKEKGGVKYMCKIFDEVAEEARAKEREEQRKRWLSAVINLAIALKVTINEAMNLLKIPEDEQAELIKMV